MHSSHGRRDYTAPPPDYTNSVLDYSCNSRPCEHLNRSNISNTRINITRFKMPKILDVLHSWRGLVIAFVVGGCGRGVVTALKPVRVEQVRRPEWKQNWTVPYCGSVLPICLSLRPVACRLYTYYLSCSPRADIGGPNCQSITPYNMKYFYSFFGIIFQFYFYFFDWSGPVRVLVPSYRSPRHWVVGGVC